MFFVLDDVLLMLEYNGRTRLLALFAWSNTNASSNNRCHNVDIKTNFLLVPSIVSFAFTRCWFVCDGLIWLLFITHYDDGCNRSWSINNGRTKVILALFQWNVTIAFSNSHCDNIDIRKKTCLLKRLFSWVTSNVKNGYWLLY